MSRSWTSVVTGVALGTHYTSENLPVNAAWTGRQTNEEATREERREGKRGSERRKCFERKKAQGGEMRVRDPLVLK